MSIIKDLINISLMIMLLFVLYKTNNGSVAIVCATLVMLLYCLKYIRLNNMIQQAIDKEALKQQQFFTEVLAHDLKTPTLAQLRGLELIQNEIVGTISKEQQELVEQIKESCKYVLDMISQIIRIYNIEHGLQKIVYEKVNMEEILLKSFENVDSAAKEKGVEFVYLASGIDTVLEAVQKDIKIVITNMLMNAIVYSNAGEKIFIKFEKISNSLKFEIITKYPERLKDDIICTLKHGATLIKSKGMFTDEDSSMVVSIINTRQVPEFLRLLKRYPNTFVYYTDVTGVEGNFRWHKDDKVK